MCQLMGGALLLYYNMTLTCCVKRMAADIRVAVVAVVVLLICSYRGGHCSVIECPSDHVFSTGGYDVDLSGLKG